MPNTFPNQKMVIIHKDRPESNFLQISNDHWMEFNKKYGPFALQLYLYFAKNANNYPLALSQKAAENEAGITKTTFHKYVGLLVDEGYLVWRNGNTYDFYETPRKQEKENAESSPCGKSLGLQDEPKNLPHKHHSSPYKAKSTQGNKEIYNTYKNNQDIVKDIHLQTEEGDITRTATKEFVF